MVKKGTRILSLLLGGTMIFSCAGCSGGGKSSVSPVQQTSTADVTFPLKEPITISAMTYDFGRPRDLKIDKEWEKKTNVKVNWTTVSTADYDNVLKVKLSSGELPDMMKTSKPILDTYGSQGLFVDLYPYFSQEPNMKKWVQKFPAILNDVVTGDNKCYGLDNFNTRGQIPRSFIYRDDLFKKEGLSEPKTVDDLYDDLVKLKAKYPDSTPIISRWGEGNLLGTVATMYQTSNTYYLDNKTLTYQYGPTTENFKRAIAMLAKFYKAKLIDPEFATISDDQFDERITTGKAFAMFAEYTCEMTSDGGNTNWVKLGKITNPDFSLKATAPLSTEVGTGFIQPQYPTAQGGIAISISAKSKYVDQIVALLNYQLSDEMIDLTNWGIEGQTYTVKDGKKDYMPGVDAKALSSFGVDGRSGMWVPIAQDASDQGVLSTTDQNTVDAMNAQADKISLWSPKKAISFSQEEIDQNNQINTPLSTYVDEQLIGFITGKQNMTTDWDNFQAKLKEMNYMQVVQRYNDAYAKLPEDQKGLDKNLGLN